MDAKDEIKRRLSVEEVVGDYLELKRAGRSLKAISPFTPEKTASFMVSPEKQIWYDFSSNRGGDMFSFIMEVEGVEFREALELLAKKANLDLSQFGPKDSGLRRKSRTRALEAHKLAAQFYHLCLSRHLPALGYVKDGRHFTAQTIKTWQLGYSPDGGRSLTDFLTKRHFSEKELVDYGLATNRNGRVSDLFRGRLMIPLTDRSGAVVGFTARILRDQPGAPKYFNTPQTVLYDKGRQIFGLYQARAAIRQRDLAVVVEGNLDVIASHQAAEQQVVACAGTALTSDHLLILSRLTANIILAFDADEAGLKAAERAIGLAQNIDINLRIIAMPDGFKDPDELIQRQPAAWSALIDQAEDAVSWLLARYRKVFDINSAVGKKQLSDKLLGVIGQLRDPVEREHHLRGLATQLNVSFKALNTKLVQLTNKHSVGAVKVKKKFVQTRRQPADATALEDGFLSLNACFPDVRPSLSLISVDSLHTADRKIIFERLQQLSPRQRLKIADLHQLADYVKILAFTAEEKYAHFSPAELMSEAMAIARRIQKSHKTELKDELASDIRQAEDEGADERVAELLQSYQALLKGKE